MELETLRIFGLRANYMQTFRDLLAKEGMRVERETVALPRHLEFREEGPEDHPPQGGPEIRPLR